MTNDTNVGSMTMNQPAIEEVNWRWLSTTDLPLLVLLSDGQLVRQSRKVTNEKDPKNQRILVN